jgi:hypothetical protein
MLSLRDSNFAERLYIVVDCTKEMEEALYNVKQAFAVQNAVPRLLSGEISPDEYLELVETHIPRFDDYIEEICENIELFLENE